VEGEHGTCLIELPALGGCGNGGTGGVDPGQSLVIESQDVDLIRKRTLLRIDNIWERNVMDPEDFALLR
jgi:hypothetical protein